MKTIGLVGGTGWVSTSEYYRIINEAVNERLGGTNFARCILYSLNYGDIDRCNGNNDLEGIRSLLLDAAGRVTAAGAECLALCANTLHYFAGDIERDISIPLIHIGETTATEVRKKGFSTVGLLGTAMTMEKDFYTSRLRNHGIETIVPGPAEREYIDRTIRSELIMSRFTEAARDRFLSIIEMLKGQGAQGIILGCTEIPLLISQKDTDIPLFHTTSIHAGAIVEFALAAP